MPFAESLLKIVGRHLSWSQLKIGFNVQTPRVVYFKERQIWWTSLGENIGVEQNGKNCNFERPVVILKKFSQDSFWALPISSQGKVGKYYHAFTREGRAFCINLSQIRLLSSKRLLRLIGDLDLTDYRTVRNTVKDFLEINDPPTGGSRNPDFRQDHNVITDYLEK